MKKIIAISLLAVLLFGSAGGWLIYKIQQQVNYSYVKQQLKNTENLTSITLSKAGYKKSKVNEHEILLNGKMYDVEKLTFKKDSVILFCMADEKEDELIASYLSIKNEQKEKGNSHQQLIKFLSLIYLQTSQYISSLPFINIEVCYSAYHFSFKPAAVSIESPPPKKS